MPVTEADVLKHLSKVADPELGRDIVSLGMVKDVKIDGGVLAFEFELTTAACPIREKFEGDVRKAAEAIPGIREVRIKVTARPAAAGKVGAMIPGVRNVIAIASGKGGVGKSTVTANLALALANAGTRVGLMDADVYGPSIPIMFGITKEKPVGVGDKITPIERYGIKIISAGFFIAEGEALIWRGPMLAGIVKQFLTDVAWGELDYLLVDLPPGTGDVQLTLSQMIPLTGSVIVSTPQDVALMVAAKAIYMFQKLNVPILGIIENMAWFSCPHCHERTDIFGSGGARKAADRAGYVFLGEVPLDSEIREAGDKGKPIVLAQPDSTLSKAFTQVAFNMAGQVSVRNLTTEEIKVG
ncbi:MAG: Mrp/NBP35 family ATP-binding protein [Planctomycetota bacterium]